MWALLRKKKVKIQRFLSGSPSFYKDKIQFDERKTLEEAFRKANYLYDQSKDGENFQKTWKDKEEMLDQRKKGFKCPFSSSGSNTYQQGQPTQSGSKVK